MRLIDADALIVEFLRYPMVLRHSGDFVTVNLDAVIHEVRKAPTIEAEPVKPGRWEKQQELYSCSECGKVCPYDVQADAIVYWPCNYCPNCGATMDGGENNAQE